MKIFSFLFFAILLLLIGALGYVAFTDVPVPQNEVVQTIPHEQIFDDKN